MSDNTNDRGGGKGRPPEGRKPRAAGAGKPAGRSRPPREGASDDKPFRKRTPRDGDAPRARPARAGDDKPFRSRTPRDGDAPRARPAHAGDDKPFRSRTPRDGDAPRTRPARAGDDKPFRSRTPRDGDAPRARPARAGDDKPFRSRTPRDGDAPRARPARSGEGKPFRGRSEDRQRSYSREDAPGLAQAGKSGAGKSGADTTVSDKPVERQDDGERIAKVMARAGLCSRRDAEGWIEQGRVSVNGAVITSPALDVTRADVVVVDGTPLPTRERTRLFLYHKPRGLVTTARDPEGRETVFGRLPPGLPRVVTVGRLDINTEGLLLLTNDGGLSRVLELPDTGWLRRYRVRAYGDITQADLDRLRDGVTIDGMQYGPVEAELDREKGDNVWLTIGLREGKNREVKRILEHLGMQVNRLIRVSFGPFQLGDLPEGTVEEVRTRVLADQLGNELAGQAQVDFEAPVFVYDEEEDVRPRAKETRAKEARAPAARAERPERPGRAERPSRGRDRDAGGDRAARPRREGSGRDAAPMAADERPKPVRRHPTEVRKSVWRAGDDQDAATPRAHQPRRGADPKAARSESGERVHERAGKVQDRRGRAVLVERIKVDPAARVREEPKPERAERAERAPRPRDEAPRRNLWSDETPEGRGDRPARRPRDGEAGERPSRPRADTPRRSRPDGEGRSFGRRAGGDGERSAGSGERTARSFGGKPGSGGKKPFGERKSFGERQSFGGGDRKPFNKGAPRDGSGPRDKQRTEGDRPATGRFGKPGGGKPGGGPRAEGRPGGRSGARPGGRPGGAGGRPPRKGPKGPRQD